MHPLPFGSLGAACGHSAALGMKGFWGHGVMLEPEALRCLLTMVPLHIRAKKDLPQVCSGCVKNMETTWLCVGGQKGAVGDSPLFFVLLLLCTWEQFQTTTIAWLQHESNAEHSLQQLRVALTAGSCAQTNQRASGPSRCSERLGGPSSSSGAL